MSCILYNDMVVKKQVVIEEEELPSILLKFHIFHHLGMHYGRFTSRS